jgi:KaiC/GvpD/RAD55 family RecA-like ATPase
MEVGATEPTEITHAASTERLSSGFERLDAMLGGGLFRGGSTLITGVPGTSKTTLAGKFAEAACQRGERTLFVSFDEGAEPIARNLSSVGIQLKPHVKSGLLRMYSSDNAVRTVSSSDREKKLRTMRSADPAARAPSAAASRARRRIAPEPPKKNGNGATQ